LHLIAETEGSIWEFDIVYPVYTAEISVLEYFVDDGDNNRMDIGETSDVYYIFENIGGAAIDDVVISVSSIDPFLTINDNIDSPGLINSEQSINAYYNFTADPLCLPGHVAILNFHITGSNDFETDIEAYLSVGQILEDWETAGFETYNWTNSGDLPWIITDVEPYEGTYCLKSGDITHEQNSTLEIELQVIAPGQIKFYKKVSSENNYDYLRFYIDGIEFGSWCGEVDWSENSYNVSAGVRSFKWVYAKDYSVDSGSDCAWIDLIEFPSIYDAEPLLVVSATEINKSMYPDETDTETIYISNQGGGIIDYNLEIYSDVPWLRESRSVGGSSIQCSENSFNTGDTVAWIFTAFNDSDDSEWIEQISMDFPGGFVIDSLTDYFDQSEDTLLLISGTPGDGSDFTWLGENDEGWGLIVGGETATTTVYGRISEQFTENMTINYSMQGDIYGAEPHSIDSSITIINYGSRIQWVSTQTEEGSLGIGQEDEIVLDFNTANLEPGDYTCILKVYSNVDAVAIPINLTVIETVEVNPEILWSQVKVFPNPADDYFVISFGEEIIKRVEVFNSLGQLLLNEKYTDNTVIVNVENFKSGIYSIRVYSDYGVYTGKVFVK
jgi:hypothetical protein